MARPDTPRRILVVDDDAPGRYLLETVSRSHGYAVTEAVDGLEALEMAREDPPDLIVTDILMPRMDGYKLCVALKEDPALRHVPVMVYTASFGEAADERFAMSLGVDSFMLKPQDPPILLAEVDRLLGESRTEPETPSPGEPGILKEYGERISSKLYEKLLELEDTNGELSDAMKRLSAEMSAKDALLEELSLAVTKEQATREQLLASQERYAAAVHGVNDGIWDWDLITGEFFVSPRFRELIGMPEDEPLVTSEQWLERVAREDVERLRFEIDLHMRALVPYFESEYRVVLPDGEIRWMLSRGQALRRADGAPYRMAGSLTDITERKRQQEELLRNALYDGLTGLPNRTLFMDRIAFLETRRSRQNEPEYAVMCIDLDRFKNFNDTLGHEAGDSLLVEVSKRLADTVRDGDTAARFGGDEFMLLVGDIDDPRAADGLADRVQEVLRAPYVIGGQEFYASASIGIVIPMESEYHPEEIVRDAETAMYRAKEYGTGRAEVFDEGMRVKTVSSLEIESELRRAIERGELITYYQPVVSTTTGGIVSFEALVRWSHPQRGLLLPKSFVHVAEQTGLIVPIDRLVLRAACLQNKAWQEAGFHVTTSVNVSARQFTDPGLAETVAQILRETGMDPADLVLEVTESIVMQDPEAAEGILDDLHALGVSLALDDFGKGYSSLSYLKRFPFQTLKIDRGFVVDIPHDAGDMTIVEAVVGLAHSLKLQVTAEGVETPEQIAFLRDLDCDKMQGYLLSQPVPSGETERLLSDGGLLRV